MTTTRTLTPTLARRLAVTRQGLAGERLDPNLDGILKTVRRLGCLQMDPLRAVERSQLLVFWSRLGSYDPADLSTLLWQQRKLFEYWAHAASIVLTEDYPIYRRHMLDWAKGDRSWMKRTRAWMAENQAFIDAILSELRQSDEPLSARQFKDHSPRSWKSSGWTSGQTITMMLSNLWRMGQIMICRRQGATRLWGLPESCLPEWTPQEEWEWPEVVYRATQRSLRALGIARPVHIEQHFTRERYPGLQDVLIRLEAEGRILRVQIEDDGRLWPGRWFIHVDDLATLDGLEGNQWSPRTTLLSPFDNLICDRNRTEQLFDFHFRIEIYVPKAKRQYGYYVLPILGGDRLIGRIDPKMDRKNHQLNIHAVYAEPDAPQSAETGQAVAAAVEELATFLGARTIIYSDRVPDGWRKALK